MIPNNFDPYYEMDKAVEIMNSMSGYVFRKKWQTKDESELLAIEAELDALERERRKLLSGDEQTLKKVLSEYSEKVTEYFRNGGV